MEAGQRVLVFRAVEINVKDWVVVLADKHFSGFVADGLLLFLQYFAFSEIGDAAFCVSFFAGWFMPVLSFQVAAMLVEMVFWN